MAAKLTIRAVAQVIELLYYNGVVKVNQGLTEETFMAYAKQALSRVIRDIWWTLKANGEREEYDFISDMLSSLSFEIKNKKDNRIIDLSEVSFIHLPDNGHIFELIPISDTSCDCETIVPAPTGSAKFYKSIDFEGFPFYEVRSKEIRLYHVPECIKEVELTGLIEREFMDEELIVPYDIAFDIVNQVLGVVLKLKTYPFDKNDADNPINAELNNQLKQSRWQRS